MQKFEILFVIIIYLPVNIILDYAPSPEDFPQKDIIKSFTIQRI